MNIDIPVSQLTKAALKVIQQPEQVDGLYCGGVSDFQVEKMCTYNTRTQAIVLYTTRPGSPIEDIYEAIIDKVLEKDRDPNEILVIEGKNSQGENVVIRFRASDFETHNMNHDKKYNSNLSKVETHDVEETVPTVQEILIEGDPIGEVKKHYQNGNLTAKFEHKGEIYTVVKKATAPESMGPTPYLEFIEKSRMLRNQDLIELFNEKTQNLPQKEWKKDPSFIAHFDFTASPVALIYDGKAYDDVIVSNNAQGETVKITAYFEWEGNKYSLTKVLKPNEEGRKPYLQMKLISDSEDNKFDIATIDPAASIDDNEAVLADFDKAIESRQRIVDPFFSDSI